MRKLKKTSDCKANIKKALLLLSCLFWAFLIMIIIGLLICLIRKAFPAECLNSLRYGMPNADLSGTNITFGVTYSAFSITAMSLMPLLKDKSWYDKMKKLNIVNTIIGNYKLCIILNMILTLWGVIGKIIFNGLGHDFKNIYNMVSLYGLIFLTLFIYKNVHYIVRLFLIKNK